MVQPVGEELTVGQPGQRVVEGLVGQARLQGSLRGDVTHGEHPAAHRVVVVEVLQRALGVDLATVGVPQAQGQALLAAVGAAEEVGHHGPVGLGDEVDQAVQLAGRSAQHAQRGGAGEGDPRGPVQDEDEVAAVLHQGSQAALADLGDLPLGQLALGRAVAAREAVEPDEPPGADHEEQRQHDQHHEAVGRALLVEDQPPGLRDRRTQRPAVTARRGGGHLRGARDVGGLQVLDERLERASPGRGGGSAVGGGRQGGERGDALDGGATLGHGVVEVEDPHDEGELGAQHDADEQQAHRAGEPAAWGAGPVPARARPTLDVQRVRHGHVRSIGALGGGPEPVWTAATWHDPRMARLPDLRVAFVPGVTPDTWVERYHRLRRGAVELVPVPESEQESGLREGAVDMALVRLPVHRDGLHCVRLYEERPVVVVDLEHLVTAVDPADEVDLTELDEEQLVLPERSGWVPSVEQRDWPVMGVHEAVAVAASGAGVLVLPQSVARLHHRRDVTTRAVRGLPTTAIALAWLVERDDASPRPSSAPCGDARRTARAAEPAPSPSPSGTRPAPDSGRTVRRYLHGCTRGSDESERDR